MPNNPAMRRTGAEPVSAANQIVRRAGLPVASTSPENAAPGTADQPTTIRETGGPTVLTVGAIADGTFVKRVGATLVGVDPLAGGLNATVPLAKLTGAGVNGSLTFTKGILTARVDPT